LMKHLKPLSNIPPKPIITWDKYERIVRNQEIWANPSSIVHRLPSHYQQRYWKNVLSNAAPVHYQMPKYRFMWDTKRLVKVELEEYPIRPLYVPEMDKGLWGGEGVVKGYKESNPFIKKKILPRHWIPRFYYPDVRDQICYSEVLDKYFKIVVTPRALRLIDEAFGLDYYLLNTPEIDVNSKLGMRLKRSILMTLAKGEYYSSDEDRHEYIKQKYASFVIPLEEAEWVGFDLNEACRKLQDMKDNTAPIPEKYIFERELMAKLEKGEDLAVQEEEFVPKTQPSLFAEKAMGKFMKPIEDQVRRF